MEVGHLMTYLLALPGILYLTHSKGSLMVVIIISSSSLLPSLMFQQMQQTGRATEIIHSGPNFRYEMSQLLVKDKAENLLMKENFTAHLNIHWFIILSFHQQGKGKLCFKN